MPFFNNAVFGLSEQHQLESNPFNYGTDEAGTFPPPGSFFIITETGIYVISETGNMLITE